MEIPGSPTNLEAEYAPISNTSYSNLPTRTWAVSETTPQIPAQIPNGSGGTTTGVIYHQFTSSDTPSFTVTITSTAPSKIQITSPDGGTTSTIGQISESGVVSTIEGWDIGFSLEDIGGTSVGSITSVTYTGVEVPGAPTNLEAEYAPISNTGYSNTPNRNWSASTTTPIVQALYTDEFGEGSPMNLYSEFTSSDTPAFTVTFTSTTPNKIQITSPGGGTTDNIGELNSYGEITTIEGWDIEISVDNSQNPPLGSITSVTYTGVDVPGAPTGLSATPEASAGPLWLTSSNRVTSNLSGVTESNLSYYYLKEGEIVDLLFGNDAGNLGVDEGVDGPLDYLTLIIAPSAFETGRNLQPILQYGNVINDPVNTELNGNIELSLMGLSGYDYEYFNIRGTDSGITGGAVPGVFGRYTLGDGTNFSVEFDAYEGAMTAMSVGIFNDGKQRQEILYYDWTDQQTQEWMSIYGEEY